MNSEKSIYSIKCNPSKTRVETLRTNSRKKEGKTVLSSEREIATKTSNKTSEMTKGST